MFLSNEKEEGSEKMNQMNTISPWSATANSYEKGKTLEGNEEEDVVVIGAGFTDLSSAYHLQKLGKNVIVLEQETIGYGASGRTYVNAHKGLIGSLYRL